MNQGGPLLLYDGTCGFCARSVQFVLEHEGARHDLRFAPLDDAAAPSIVWCEPATGDRYTRFGAVLRLAAYLGGPWRVLGAIGRLVPTAVGNAAYDFIARHRHRIAGRDVCVRPSLTRR
jgi:predicted DCC family thiol-disulfide oxidoreductase YuxK